MKSRLNHFAVAPQLMQPMLYMEECLNTSGLEHSLIELVKLRLSQINGCAFCIHMHTHDARAQGESEDRLHLLNARRESSLYSERECAALA
ncbi:carboxymuconolactone decarboxylase family protein [Ruegeria sp. Alg231-54]|uniref:carboxymuconolactone decarboxylase family protein n=1 Tax=Ruegeria sp. Alg231-54 TaxID=1922221 RepID=UPI0019008B74|nr:carboxymuconolactone decarboxylase family protein [Ruegeria sp. Alg231-54]